MVKQAMVFRIALLSWSSLAVWGCAHQVGTPFNWYAAHADSRNSDYSPVKGPTNITLAWQRKFKGTINLGPTNDQSGKIFITTSGEGCHLFAVDQRTGETVWCTAEVNKFAVASSALVDENGNVYVADNEAMHAFDNSGALLWETPIQGFPFSAQFTPANRLIFITHIGIVYVLNKETGACILPPLELSKGNSANGQTFDPVACMRGTEDCPCANTLAMDPVSGKFYFTYWEPGTTQAAVVAMQYSENPFPAIAKIWENDSLPGGSATSPDIAFNGKRLYVNDNTGGLHAIDANTGKSIWKFDLGYASGGSQSTSPNGLIVPAGGANAPLLCLQDKGDRPVVRWRMDSVFNRGVATQAANGLIYATVANMDSGRFHNSLLLLEAKTGKQIGRKDLPGVTIFTVGTTIGPEGNIYVPSFNGTLFAFTSAYREQENQHKRTSLE